MHSSADIDPLARALDAAAERIVQAVRATENPHATVLIDGRSGAGKSSLADRVIAAWPFPDALTLLRLDSIYPGWDGLQDASASVAEELLAPRSRGSVGVWHAWDWERGERAGTRTLNPDSALVVEGCGALTGATSEFADVRVWVDAPRVVRESRALERDGETFRPHWERWARQEEAHIDEHAPRELADIILDLP